MKNFAFERYVPSFKATFWLIIMVAAFFGLSWLIVYSHAVRSENVPKVSCATSWEQDDKVRRWHAEAKCPFGNVKVVVDSSSEEAMYWMTVKGRPDTLQCWKIDYPSGFEMGCKIPF